VFYLPLTPTRLCCRFRSGELLGHETAPATLSDVFFFFGFCVTIVASFRFAPRFQRRLGQLPLSGLSRCWFRVLGQRCGSLGFFFRGAYISAKVHGRLLLGVALDAAGFPPVPSVRSFFIEGTARRVSVNPPTRVLRCWK